jgi:type IV pilus assembly protein PilA
MQNTTAGFTLLELLLVMTIISILSAVAIPQYRDFKVKAYDAKAEIELRNVSLAEELYFSDHDEYLSCTNEECLTLPSLTKISEGISVEVQADEDSFTATAHHEKGKRTFSWDSASGGFSSSE